MAKKITELNLTFAWADTGYCLTFYRIEGYDFLLCYNDAEKIWYTALDDDWNEPQAPVKASIDLYIMQEDGTRTKVIR
jgi:hypothetical protein